MRFDDLRKGDVLTRHGGALVALTGKRTSRGAEGKRLTYWRGRDRYGCEFDVFRAGYDRGDWVFTERPARTVKVRLLITLDVDVDAYALTYGGEATASAVRRDLREGFASSITQASDVNLAWGEYCTAIEVH